MKLITRDTDYAVRALCFIAQKKNTVVSAKELIERLNVPRSFIRKILQKLNKVGLLKSRKGLGGGFALAVRSKELTLCSLVEAMQGPVRLSEHTFRGKCCPEIKLCKLKSRLDAIEKKVAAELRTITIDSLMKNGA
ncbi:MAG: Rrf2 family transcriptional regulator [Candidatus Omnitrophota bacterium]